MTNTARLDSTFEKSDSDLKRDVINELDYDPAVKAGDISVTASNGTITLSGFVSTFWEKWGAVAATKRVWGVEAIADDIKVRLPNENEHSDTDLASAAALRIKTALSLPPDTVKIVVRDGTITLEGTVEWWYQKNLAETSVKYLTGVKCVSNLITIRPKMQSAGIEAAITAAFERSAILESNKISVTVYDNQVTLSGEVRTHAERDEAERAAWSAPGVRTVNNQITVAWSWFSVAS